jgi:hypothetical protein
MLGQSFLARVVAGSLAMSLSFSGLQVESKTTNDNLPQEALIKARLHHGLSRLEFYSLAERVGVDPVNFDYVGWKISNSGRESGLFPLPTARCPHPSVQMFFRHQGDFMWKEDRLSVEFDKLDRVSSWKWDSYYSGA